MPKWNIDIEQTIQNLGEMVAINSINPDLDPEGPGETQIADWLVKACNALGLETRTQEAAPGRPNVIARWPGSGGGRSVLLTGHTDVVAVQNMEIPPFEPRIEDGKMYGRGSFDMKAGLAAILGAVAALKSDGFRPAGDVILGFVADEEFASIGTSALVKEVKADAAILTEPSGLSVGIAHKGYAWVQLKTEGRAAHGSLHDVGIDAIAHAGRLLAELERLEREVYPKRSHPLLGRPSAHAGLISGGLGFSTYPDACTLDIEHRSLPDETAEEIVAVWHEAITRLGKADPNFKATAAIRIYQPGYEIAPDAPIVQTVAQAHRAALGKETGIHGMFGWLDSAILSRAGIPVAVYGPGGTGAHAAVEYVDLESVRQCAATLAEATAAWCG